MKKVTLILISLLLCLCLVGCDDDHDDVVDNDSDDVVEVKNTITPLEDKKITGYNSYDILPYKLNVEEGSSIVFRVNIYDDGEWTFEDCIMDTADEDSIIFGLGVNTYPELDIDSLPATLIYYQFDDDLKVETRITAPRPINFKDMSGVSTSWLQSDHDIVDGEYQKQGDLVYDKAIVITLIVTYKG